MAMTVDEMLSVGRKFIGEYLENIHKDIEPSVPYEDVLSEVQEYYKDAIEDFVCDIKSLDSSFEWYLMEDFDEICGYEFGSAFEVAEAIYHGDFYPYHSFFQIESGGIYTTNSPDIDEEWYDLDKIDAIIRGKEYCWEVGQILKKYDMEKLLKEV